MRVPAGGVYGASGRRWGVKRRPGLTNIDYQRPSIMPVQRRHHRDDLGGDGRVGLYAGFCGRRPWSPVAAIHLGLPLPAGSCGLPAGSGEQPSNACAGRHLAVAALLGLAPGGVYRATPVTRGAGELLPHRFTLTGTTPRRGPAVCFLWHFPAGRPGLPLTTTLLCGVRTFLGSAPEGTDATARPTRPSPGHSTGARRQPNARRQMSARASAVCAGVSRTRGRAGPSRSPCRNRRSGRAGFGRAGGGPGGRPRIRRGSWPGSTRAPRPSAPARRLRRRAR